MLWLLFTFLLNVVVSYFVPMYCSVTAVIRKEPLQRWLIFWVCFIAARMLLLPVLDLIFDESYFGRVLVGVALLAVSALKHDAIAEGLARGAS
jgi:hypothetical protein